MKIGIEVEGVLRGKKTLFLQSYEILKYKLTCLHDLESLLVNRKDLDLISEIEHVYISDHDDYVCTKLSDNSFFKFFQDLEKRKFLVTIEKTILGEYRKSFPPNIGIILAISDYDNVGSSALKPNRSFWNLLDSDQIKFSRKSPNATNDSEHDVYCVRKHLFGVTDPSEFKDDHTLFLKS